LSVGFLINGNGIDGTGKPTTGSTNINIGGKDYILDSIGLDLSYNTFAPYIGLGFDTTFGDEDNWGFVFDLGVLFSGSPEAKLSPRGSASVLNDPTFQSDVEKEKQEIQDELNQFEFWPVLSAGIVYQF
jgi:hypothetical protein